MAVHSPGSTTRSPKRPSARLWRCGLAALLAVPVLAVADSGSSAPVLVTPTSAAEVDHALVFDGVDGVAAASTTVIPTSNAQPFTVEAWVLDPAANDAAYRHILSQGNGGTAFYFGTTANSQQIRAGDTWLSTGVDLPVGRWVHLALTTPGDGTAKLYLDGRLAATQASGFSAPTGLGSPFRLGTQFNSSEYWNGRIDTVRVWTTERTAGELSGSLHAAVAPGTSGLVAQYLANEGTGTTVANSVSAAAAGTDLTRAGGVAWAPVATTTQTAAGAVVTFPRSAITAAGGWQVPAGVTSVDVLAVGGGGGGGAWVGGGGGGGGMTETSGIALTPGHVVPVTVGLGGGGAVKETVGFTAASNGEASSFGGYVTVMGGGHGGSWNAQMPSSGGSGGGGSYLGAGWDAFGAGTSGQGHRGGSPFSNAQPHAAGGGGGAGGVGGNGPSSSVSGDGGPGRLSSITGTAVLYGGGGGGSSHGTWGAGPPLTVTPGTPGSGGTGGGGNGAAAVATSGTVAGQDGTSGLGGGGGGAANNCGSPCEISTGGDGGSGIVVLRFASTGLLTVATQPAGGAPGGRLVTQPVITVRGLDGNVATGDSVSTVTVSASTGATLSGTTTVTAASGVASFSDLNVDGPEDTDIVLTFTVSSGPGVTVAASPLRVGIYRDDATAGGGWDLVAYGANGVLGGYLTATSGSYDPATRTGQATVDAVDRFRAGNEMAISWNRTGTPTGGLESYDHAVSFVLPSPGSMTLTGSGTPSTAVTVNELVGSFGFSAVQYVQPLTLGAAYSGSYGFTNDSVDWGPDSQNRQALYLDHPGPSGHVFPQAYATRNGTNTGYVPSTMAIWVRSAADTATALDVVRAAVAPSGGGSLTSQPVVRLVNAAASTVSANSTLAVTVTSSAGATLAGTTSVTVSGGVATFTDLSLSGVAGSYTLTYSTPGLVPVTQSVTIASPPTTTPVPSATPLPPLLPPAESPSASSSTTTVPDTTGPTSTTPTTSVPVTTPPSGPVVDETGRLPEIAPGFVTGRDEFGAVQVELNRLDSGRWTIEGLGYQMTLDLESITETRGPDAAIAIAAVRAGTQFMATGVGLAPGTFVDVWVFSEPRLLGRLVVDADGRAAGDLAVPGDLTPGDHTLQINGRVPGGGVRSVSLGLRVLVASDSGPSSTETGILPATGHDPWGLIAWAFALAAVGSVVVIRRRVGA